MRTLRTAVQVIYKLQKSFHINIEYISFNKNVNGLIEILLLFYYLYNVSKPFCAHRLTSLFVILNIWNFLNL